MLKRLMFILVVAAVSKSVQAQTTSFRIGNGVPVWIEWKCSAPTNKCKTVERAPGYTGARRLVVRACAEDVASEVFLKVAKGIHGFPGLCVEDFRRWLFRIATNEINAHLRQSIRRRKLLEAAAQMGRINASVSGPLLGDTSPIDWQEVYEALGSLTDREQSIISLRFFGGLKYEQIAEVMEQEVGTIRVALSRALDRLRTRLGIRNVGRRSASNAPQEDFKNDDDLHQDWDTLFSQLPVDTTLSVEQLEEVKRCALDAFESRLAPRSQHITLQTIGHTLKKYKVPHGIAATLIIACTFWLIQSTSTSALALDVLIEKFMRAKTARYDSIVTVEGQPPLKMKGFYLEPVHMRETNEMPTVTDVVRLEK